MQCREEGLLRATSRAIVPRDERGSMIHQEVVAHAITSAMKLSGKEHRLIGSVQHLLVALALANREPLGLPRKGNNGYQVYIGEALPQPNDLLAGSQIEAYGHAAQEGTRPLGIKRSEQRLQLLIGFTPIGAMARKGHGRRSIHRGNKFSVKIQFLARSLLLEGCFTPKKSTLMKHSTICAASMLGGMILGAVLAMLLTPQSGPELRHKIKDFVDDEMDKVKTKAEQMQQKLQAEIEAARCKCGEEKANA